jgi:hypothetical protein
VTRKNWCSPRKRQRKMPFRTKTSDDCFQAALQKRGFFVGGFFA